MAIPHRIIPTLTSQDAERFWSKVAVRNSDECWEWQNSCFPDGYGGFKLKGQTLSAHRIAWTIVYGPIPVGMQVLHRCDNPPCQNPTHLFLGTNADNMRDRNRKGRTAYGNKNGAYTHPERVLRGEHTGRAKLTERQVRRIRTTYRQESESTYALASRFGVGQTTVKHILHRDTWRHVH